MLSSVNSLHMYILFKIENDFNGKSSFDRLMLVWKNLNLEMETVAWPWTIKMATTFITMLVPTHTL